METMLYYLGFSFCHGIGPVYFNELIKKCGSVEKAYKASHTQLRLVLGQAGVITFEKFREAFNAEKIYKKLSEQNITVLSQEDPRYSTLLQKFRDSPICLYVKGNTELINFNENLLIGVVGTRTPTSYGIKITKQFAKELVEGGCVIVSGMARGIDGLAHRTALENNGKTVAVLGSGVNHIYPYENGDIYKTIIDGGGVVMSEFPPHLPAKPGMFVARNRVIAGISKGVLVVEGAKNSGALTTANSAADQGHDVFIIPGPITSKLSYGPNSLLFSGAKPALSSKDILEAYGRKRFQVYIEKKVIGLPPEETAVVALLQNESLSVDDIYLATQLSIQKVLCIVSVLEIKGIVERNKEGNYQLK